MYCHPLVSAWNWFKDTLGTKIHRFASPFCKIRWYSWSSTPKEVEFTDAEPTGMGADYNHIPLPIEINPQDKRDTIS